MGYVTMPAHGDVAKDDENILYSPDTDYCGPDVFTYTLTDSTGTHSATATVSVDVLCAPAEPIETSSVGGTPTTSPIANVSARIVANDDSFTTSQNTTVELYVLDNDVNYEGKPLARTNRSTG